MIQVPMILVRPALLSMLDAMSDEEIEPIAAAHPVLRKCLVPVGAEVAAMASAPAPGPAKAREPKATPAIDKEALAAQVLAYVDRIPNQRGEDIALAVGPTVPRDEAQSFARTVRGILEKFVTDGKMYADGERRGRRYKVAAAPAHQEDGGTE